MNTLAVAITTRIMTDHDDQEYKSKSQLKREMLKLQDLGEALVKLPAKTLTKIPMPDELRDAIDHARAIKSHGAQRRQLQYIGKLMRSLDPAPIQQALDAIRRVGQRATDRFHHVEHWRDRLIAEGPDAIDALLAEHPAAERQRLRQLLLNIQREHQHHQPPKAARALFRYLREIMESLD